MPSLSIRSSCCWPTCLATFKYNALLGIKTETEKMMMLAALNLVECIAEAAPQTVT